MTKSWFFLKDSERNKDKKIPLFFLELVVQRAYKNSGTRNPGDSSGTLKLDPGLGTSYFILLNRNSSNFSSTYTTLY